MRTLTLLTALAALVAAAPAANAAPVGTQAVRQVCAQDLYVRSQPAGVIIGTLYRGDNFDVYRYSPSRDWVYGHAYGNVHRDGWVQNG